MADSEGTAPDSGGGETRRDFLDLLTGGFVVAGTAAAVWPLIHQMNPAADTLAASTTEVDLGPIEEGQSITVIWQNTGAILRRGAAGGRRARSRTAR